MSVPTHRKFGYAVVMEKEAIRRRLLAAGAVDDMALLFTIEAEYIAAHANDVPYRNNKMRSIRAVAFTRQELAYMEEHFANANDPIPASIGLKVMQYRNHLTTE